MDDMQLDYDSPPVPLLALSGGGSTAASTATSTSAATAIAAENSVATTATLKSPAQATSTKVMEQAKKLDAVLAKESNTASRILDELLGDMLAIVEQDSSSDDESNDEANDSWSTSSGSSSLTDLEQTNNDTLKVPKTAASASKANSPAASEMEEGEVESDHELEARRVKEEQKRIEAEERLKKKQERIKNSIGRNVSERDVYRYLKHRGELASFHMVIWKGRRYSDTHLMSVGHAVSESTRSASGETPHAGYACMQRADRMLIYRFTNLAIFPAANVLLSAILQLLISLDRDFGNNVLSPPSPSANPSISDNPKP